MADTIYDIMIPEEIKNCSLPSPEELEYFRLEKQRCFFIDYEIEDDYKCVELIKTIIRMNLEEKDIPKEQLQPITLYVFSYGGSLDQATALCDIIEASRIPIITVCLGVAMSAGFLIFLAGKRRYAMKQSCFLAHQGNASFEGTADMIQQAQNNYKKQLKQMKDYILSHTNINERLFNRNKSKDWYITANESIELGICQVINSLDEIK